MTDTVSLNDIMLELCKQRLPSGTNFNRPSALMSSDSRTLVLKGWTSTSIKPHEFIAMSQLDPTNYGITVSDTSRKDTFELRLTGHVQDILLFVIDFKTALETYELQHRKEKPARHTATPRTKAAPHDLAIQTDGATWAERMAAHMTPQGEARLRQELTGNSMNDTERTNALQILEALETLQKRVQGGPHRS
jgi:hypothetical protein